MGEIKEKECKTGMGDKKGNLQKTGKGVIKERDPRQKRN